MIANPTFDDAGPTPGSAASWSLRTRVAAEAIVGFDAPREHGDESFELWWALEDALAADAPRAFFALAGVESFEAGWTLRSFVDAFDAAMLIADAFDARAVDAFEWTSWRAAWNDVVVAGAFADTLETAWRNDAFVDRFDAAAPTVAVFAGAVAVETFEGTWPAIGRA